MLKTGNAPEKPNFAQICNLLSQFMKEKGRLGDITLGMARKLESKEKPEKSLPLATTMDLLTNMENSAEALRQNTMAPPDAQSSDFLQQFGCFDPSNSTDTASNEADLRKPAIKEGVMTIFYADQVLVFNDFPADKAREIIALASKGSSYASGMDKVNSGSSIAPASNIGATSQRNTIQERLQQQSQAIDSYMPRRASLHRFLEKRKDRVAAKAPYQVGSPSQVPPKAEESNPWIELEVQSSKQLELKL